MEHGTFEPDLIVMPDKVKVVDRLRKIMRYPNGQICQHTFTMKERDVRILGKDRAERDARQFCALSTE